MSYNGCSTDSQHPLNISDTGAIMGKLYNFLMGSWLVCIVEVVKLEALATKSAKESLKTRRSLAIFNNVV